MKEEEIEKIAKEVEERIAILIEDKEIQEKMVELAKAGKSPEEIRKHLINVVVRYVMNVDVAD